MESMIQEILIPITKEIMDEEMLEYMVKIRHEEDLEEFLSNIIDFNNPEHKDAIEELKRIIIGTDPRFRKNWQPPKDAKKFETITNENNFYTSPPQGSKTKKTNYIALNTSNNIPAVKKGRHPCDCEARAHDLINNCSKCGRIVCEQEGSGPCFFCGNMVVTNEEQEILNSNTKESDKLYNRLLEQKKSKEWKKAIEARNKLLNADRIGEINSTIYDDQTDYFLTHSTKDRNKRTPRSTAQMKLALDLATKTLNYDSDEDDFELNKGRLLLSLNKHLDFKVEKYPKEMFDDYPGIREKLISCYGEVRDTEELIERIERSNRLPPRPSVTNVLPKRVVNQDLIAHMDKGMCLSMHQPWASLLVAGIKKHEGRSWKTDHRGRLWIHAASREPTEAEVLSCEEFYRDYYNEPTLTFPKKYPVSCLLGCVMVDDCLPQKEYRKRYPDGESDSPYVLICSNPIVLRVFLPMAGQHKIFSLNPEVHYFAKQNILASAWI